MIEFCEQTVAEIEQDSVIFNKDNKGRKSSVKKIKLSDLDIGESIGKGGFNRVRDVLYFLPGRNSVSSRGRESLSNKRHYALKGLRDSLSSSMTRQGAIDLVKEAKFLAQLSHPNIILLHSTISNPGNKQYLLLMECLDTTLLTKLRCWKEHVYGVKSIMKLQKMKERISSFQGLASALMYLHGKNILFRDLKPGNIGFTEYGVIKIFDFGLAKELKEVDKVGEGRYKATACVGTPRYMPTEVYIGQPYGLSADVYGFSLLLYQVLTLRDVYQYGSIEKLVKNVHVREHRPSIKKGSMPNEFKEAIELGWSVNTDVRPTMASFNNIMTKFLLDDH